MLSWLLPKELEFFDYFIQSIEVAKKAAEELQKANNSQQIKTLEHEADAITHRCVEALRKTFITPIDRNDIFRLIYRLDDIVDDIYAASHCYNIYKIAAPTEQFEKLAQNILQSITELELALRPLHNLKNAPSILQRCQNVQRLESEADEIFANALGELLENEKDLRKVIIWKDIYEQLEAATNRCKDVANIIEGIVLEHS